MASQPPSIVQALDKVDQIVFRLQELQSTISVARQALSSASLNAPANARFQAAGPVPASSTNAEGEWKEWSAPAQIVHQAISEILVATKYAKQLATGEESTEAEEGFSGGQTDAEAAEAVRAEVVEGGAASTLPSEPSVVRTLVAAADASVVVRRSTEEAEGLRRVGRSKQATAAVPTVKNPLKVTKVKQYQKSWKLKSKDAVMFPNQAYSPSTPPAGSKNFRMLTPFKAKRSKAEASPSGSKAPLLGQKRDESPVKSLPLLIDRLPSKKKPPAASRRNSPRKAEQQLPYPPSHFFRNTSSSRRGTAGSKAPPFKVLESNTLPCKTSAKPEEKTSAQPQRKSRQPAGQKHLRESAEGRARSISPRKKQSDKENLLRSSLRRSSSAGTIPIPKSHASSGGHSILQRAKGWMLGLHSRHPQSRQY